MLRRILPVIAVAALWATVAGAQDEAVGVVVALQGETVSTLDLSFPGPMAMNDINTQLREITRFTGWTMTTPQVSTLQGSTSAHMGVTAAPPVDAVLTDVVWPLVAALAEYRKIGLLVMGAPVVTANLVIENRFVRLEQKGGQGVQNYWAEIKDSGFRSLDELSRAELPNSAGRGPRRGGFALAWVLLLVAAAAAGVAAYLVVERMKEKPGAGE